MKFISAALAAVVLSFAMTAPTYAGWRDGPSTPNTRLCFNIKIHTGWHSPPKIKRICLLR